MIELPRLFGSKLDGWLGHNDRRPLIVRGARQVGKSHAIRHWARRTFGDDGVLEINLEESPRFRKVFSGDLSADRIIDELNLLTGFNLRLPRRLLFIDEIQAVPSAITALRFFYEQRPQLPVVAAGSLLEFALEEQGAPVGRVEYLHLFPLSFREFLSALNKDALSQFIAAAPLDQKISESVHAELLSLLRLYMRIGGMPKAVSAYVETRDIKEVAREQKLVLGTYQDDFSKYARKSQTETLYTLFNRIPHIVGTQRVQYRRIDRDIRIEKIKRSIELLQRARVISRVTCSLARQLPLRLEEKYEFFKLVFLDIGLLGHALGFDWQSVDPDEDLSTLSAGKFAEQFVGQELLAERSSDALYQLHYWDRVTPGSSAELDYVIEHNGKVVPLEVKSGMQGSLKSLHNYIAEYSPQQAFVLSQRNIEQLGAIHWIPLYLAGQIKISSNTTD
jgi:predicted AAA+ superfamily ATPase